MIDSNGHAVGVITDLYAVDNATGRPEGHGQERLSSHHVTFVPLSAASAHGMGVQVPFDQRHIHDAPKMDHPDGRLSADEEARLYAHYGLEYGPATSDAALRGRRGVHRARHRQGRRGGPAAAAPARALRRAVRWAVLLALFAGFFPRLALLILWIARPARIDAAFDTFRGRCSASSSCPSRP